MMATEKDWELLYFGQHVAETVKHSDNLRLPSEPNKALRDMQDILKPKATHGYHPVVARPDDGGDAA